MQQALIVDDSKTVRVGLTKMLSRFDIEADSVESGEEALEYLRDKKPRMIFMDHMMPGMDGFDTVKAIKSDPATSFIPIIMHTTKSGDMYVGQARALGAADILSKPATPEALQDVIDRIERLRQTTPTRPVPTVASFEMRAMTAEMPVITDRDITRAQEANRDALTIERSASPPPRREFTSGVERSVSTIREYSPWRQVIALAIIVAPVIWMLGLYINADHHRQVLQDRGQSLYDIAGWGVSQAAFYDYGELPMSGRRLVLLRDLVKQLSDIGFRGVINVEGHSGEFCLIRVPLADGTEVDMLPSADTPLRECAFVGASSAKVLAASIAQSSAFTDFLANSPLLQGTGIRVQLIQRGTSQPVASYPADIEHANAADWNAAALQNNRVEFYLRPDR